MSNPENNHEVILDQENEVVNPPAMESLPNEEMSVNSETESENHSQVIEESVASTDAETELPLENKKSKANEAAKTEPAVARKRKAKPSIDPSEEGAGAEVSTNTIEMEGFAKQEVKLNADLIHEDEEEDEETKMMDEEESIHMDYSAYTKSELLKLATEAPKNMVPREAVKRLQNIRPFFENILKSERQDQLNSFIEAGHEEESFEPTDDGSRQVFYDAFKLVQDLRAEEKKRIEDEKLKNLEAKNAIIERIKVLTESDETKDSLNEVKQLQNDWKAIRVIPKQNLQELYDRYHFYLDKFYDNLAINRELKELDRQKNLGIKIDLCNKTDALQQEPSLKRAFILLSKYQEEFKNTGPVPREFSEEIWSRFKATVDEIYKQRKAQFDEIQSVRIENLRLKEVLVEKARLIANHIPVKGSDWKSGFEDLNKLMEEWKSIGQVPKAQNESIWHEFREQFSIFSKNRNEQFKKANTERKANIVLKEDIIKRASELKDHEDYRYATAEFKKLQEEWKTVGPVPEAISHKLWKQFRQECDVFFNKKNEHFNSIKGDEQENLNKKQGLIDDLNKLMSSEDGDEVLNELRNIQAKWNEIGFVPIKSKKSLGDQYHTLLDTIYQKFRKNKEAYKKAHLKQHYHQIAVQPGGDKKLNDDERRLREKIKGLKSEIETWENNIEFFARSKNADKFRKDIEDKIAKVNGQIEGLNKELAALRAAKV